jgi:hypothetical protein
MPHYHLAMALLSIEYFTLFHQKCGPIILSVYEGANLCAG